MAQVLLVLSLLGLSQCPDASLDQLVSLRLYFSRITCYRNMARSADETPKRSCPHTDSVSLELEWVHCTKMHIIYICPYIRWFARWKIFSNQCPALSTAPHPAHDWYNLLLFLMYEAVFTDTFKSFNHPTSGTVIDIKIKILSVWYSAQVYSTANTCWDILFWDI